MGPTLNQLATELEAYQAECDKYADLKTEAEKNKQRVTAELIKLMEAESLSSFKDSVLGKTFSITQDLNIKKVDENAIIAWIKESGNQDVIKETIHPSTFKALVKHHLVETGTNVPGVEVSTFQRISSRKA